MSFVSVSDVKVLVCTDVAYCFHQIGIVMWTRVYLLVLASLFSNFSVSPNVKQECRGEGACKHSRLAFLTRSPALPTPSLSSSLPWTASELCFATVCVSQAIRQTLDNQSVSSSIRCVQLSNRCADLQSTLTAGKVHLFSYTVYHSRNFSGFKWKLGFFQLQY